MNKDRLTDLLNVLKKTRPETFYQKHWWCGTSGCQIGHYCKEYQHRAIESGLVSDHTYFPDFDTCISGTLTFGRIAKHFDISPDSADYLFDGVRGGQTLPEAIERLEKFIADGEVCDRN